MDAFFTNIIYLSGVKAAFIGFRLAITAKHYTDGPAQVFKHPDYVGEIGLIMP